jgi:hypothetical protein
MLFLHLLRLWCDFFPYFVYEMNYPDYFLMLNQPYILGINFTWSQHIIYKIKHWMCDEMKYTSGQFSLSCPLFCLCVNIHTGLCSVSLIQVFVLSIPTWRVHSCCLLPLFPSGSRYLYSTTLGSKKQMGGRGWCAM